VGSGSSKLVYKARWRQPHASTADVAILRIRGSGATVRRQALEQEVKTWHQLGRHRSLLGLLAVTVEPSSGDYCLVTDYACQGSLERTLRSFAEEEETMGELVQLEVARQICDGMEQLSLHEVVHRELAARSVLVWSLQGQDHLGVRVKVADYGRWIMGSRGDGVSRVGSESSAGSRAGRARWMAPESLLRHRYSEKSDVWAFGVTLWEVWTYGKVPYWAITDDELVGPKVVDGERLAAPAACPPAVYAIMRECWREKIKERPSFSELRKKL
ncbi:hypothetical protein GUITHDRAFT_53133, partial [Guillardia theta CCMP2712]